MTTPHIYGLLVRREHRYGTEYVCTYVVRREESGEPTIRWCSDSDPEGDYSGCTPPRHAGKLYGGISTTGFITEYGDDHAFIGHMPLWHAGGYLSAEKLALALKSQTAVERAIRKAEAREPGDVLMAICKALGLSFVATEVGGPQMLHASASERRYVFWTVAEGRNRYRDLIEEAREAHRARAGKAVA